MSKLKCQGRICTHEDRQEWESFKEIISLFKVRCCLVDEGRWPWWAVNSSLIHNLLFLHWIPNSLGTEGYMFWDVINRNGVQNPVICLQFYLPSVCSQFYCLQFGNWLPVLLPEEQVSHQSETYSALFSGYYLRTFCAIDCCDADIWVPHPASCDGKAELLQKFLMLLPKRKIP